MEQTLLLNATYEPLKVVNWQKAITLLCQGKVEVISVYDREIRAVSFSIKLPSVIRLLRYIKIKRRFDYVPFSRANIYARDNHSCQYCGDVVSDQRADVRPRRAGRPGGPQGLGEHRHLLRLVQSQKGRAHARRGRHAPREVPEASRSRYRRFASRSACEMRPTAGAISSIGTPSSTKPDGLTRLTSIQPHWAVEGGRVTIHGSGFPIDTPHLPQVTIGDAVRPRGIRLLVVDCRPRSGGPGRRAHGGSGRGRCRRNSSARRRVRRWRRGFTRSTIRCSIAEGNLYVTYSGSRGQEVPVSIFRVSPAGRRESYVSGIVNPTSMTFDASGQLYVSSRFEGTIYRVLPNGTHEPYASDLGIACGLAFDRKGVLYVGDRSGTVFAVQPDRTIHAIATLPSSVAAFHLAVGPDDCVYVSAPTLGPVRSRLSPGSFQRHARQDVFGIWAAAGNCLRLAGGALRRRGPRGIERSVSREDGRDRGAGCGGAIARRCGLRSNRWARRDVERHSVPARCRNTTARLNRKTGRLRIGRLLSD